MIGCANFDGRFLDSAPDQNTHNWVFLNRGVAPSLVGSESLRPPSSSQTRRVRRLDVRHRLPQPDLGRETKVALGLGGTEGVRPKMHARLFKARAAPVLGAHARGRRGKRGPRAPCQSWQGGLHAARDGRGGGGRAKATRSSARGLRSECACASSKGHPAAPARRRAPRG